MQDFRALSYADPATDTRADDGDTVYAHERSADRFVPLRVKRVIGETRDAISIVLDVPEQSAHQFRYRAGQFLTLLVCIDGQEYQRCYSMSSSPAAGEDLRITVKRDRDGVVSNWLNDTAAPGHTLNAAPPRGRFVLSDTDRPLIAFAGGSGITPVFSLLRSALASTTRDARLFYANRTRDSVIFDAALASLQEQHPGRFTLRHHLDEDSGMVTAAQVQSFIAQDQDADFYVCGPGPFMDTVEATLRTAGTPAERVHLERFQAAAIPLVVTAEAGAEVAEEVTIELDRRTTRAAYTAGETLLQTARMAGLSPPSSCEIGSCGTCMARLTEGCARMINNDALDDDEVDEGWVLTCQALPTSSRVRVVYE
jgi:3-ketosteroid 9alpha-monooxygenase subunit B